MRMLVTAALAVLTLAASGCSGDETDDPDTTAASEPTSETVPETDDPATDDAEEPPVEPTAADPCTLVTDADVEAAYGVAVGPGEPGRGQHDEGDVSYTSTNCEWEAEDELEVQLSLSTAADFGGTLACTPVSYLGDEGTPTKVPGAQSATWLASEDPDEIEARLRVCTAESTLNLELDAAAGTEVDELRRQTVDLAAKAVAALG